jgi:O-antigen/teichoic acid export membrane protein
MSQLKRNLIANLIGRAWDRIVILVCIPFYLKFLGIEAYGLVGFYAALVGIFVIIDLGFGKTLNRELARLSALDGKAQEQHDLLRTLEVLYWLLSLGAGVLVIFLAPCIASNWVNPQHLAPTAVTTAIRMMGLAMVCHFPFGLYQGGLRGLDRQVALNCLVMVIGTLRGAGAVLVLWLISPSLQAFFIWQFLVNALGSAAAGWLLWRVLPAVRRRAGFKTSLLLGVWRFAAAMSGNTMFMILLGQLDKVILIKLLSLENFGYFMLASNVATSLYSISYPIIQAVFPQLVQLSALGDETRMAALYHRVSQIFSVALLPVAIVLALFPHEIIWLWTKNPVTADKTALLLSLLTLGAILAATSDLPVNLLVAQGRPHLVLSIRLSLSLVMVPAMIFMANHFGAMGAALVWAGYNGGYLLVSVAVLHRSVLRGDKWRWYFEDMGLPLSGALALGALGRFLMPAPVSAWVGLLFLAGVYALALAAASLLAPQIRATALAYLWRYQKAFEG